MRLQFLQIWIPFFILFVNYFLIIQYVMMIRKILNNTLCGVTGHYMTVY